MDSGTASGLFALAGVILAAVSAWVGAALQRRWTVADNRESRSADLAKEREARLFDHKLAAYTAYLLEQYSAREVWVAEAKVGRKPPLGATNRLYELGITLQMLGSARAANAEIEVTQATSRLLQSEPGKDRQDAAVHLSSCLVDLTNAIRADLEVEGEIFQATTKKPGTP